MPRQIKLIFPATGTEVVATMTEDQAPATCKMVWEALQKPLEATVRIDHDMGPKLYVPMPPAPDLPKEQLTLFPIPGDVLFYHYAGRLPRGEKTYELAVYWRRGGKGVSNAGWIGANLFATVTANLEGLQAVARTVLDTGPKIMRVERVE
jgi:Protein of unknown function (DUF3830)